MPDIGDPSQLSASPAQLRDLQASIAHAAIGHMAALYEMRRDGLLLDTPEREGFDRRVTRFVNAGCATCGGSGITYTSSPTRVTVTIAECACVRYTVAYVALLDPVKENRDAKVFSADGSARGSQPPAPSHAPGAHAGILDLQSSADG